MTYPNILLSSYPKFLRLTEDGVEIMVQGFTAQDVATAARAAVQEMTLGDAFRLYGGSNDDDPESTTQAAALAWWIGKSLGMSEDLIERARDLTGRLGDTHDGR